ncbi:MAG: hypothetical protein AAB573_03435 [Patescibacteria group bacterium]
MGRKSDHEINGDGEIPTSLSRERIIAIASDHDQRRRAATRVAWGIRNQIRGLKKQQGELRSQSAGHRWLADSAALALEAKDASEPKR